MEIDGSDSGEQPCISRSRSGSVHTNPMYSPHLGISESFKSVVTGDQFWISARQFLESQFVGPVDGPGEANARQLWEHWFNASKEWLSPSEIARIREATGISENPNKNISFCINLKTYAIRKKRTPQDILIVNLEHR
ncbi:hypothetical protein PSHT_07344 [Puccinia striiformis]|uniref:Uncharacterized protein n=1 Tax=Puccinia striiformis TaxID=27350 RepID=A0A2S4VYL2_9BASI|nr:hypothetical protein PSHT_07344 [Puccinia striiformis]